MTLGQGNKTPSGHKRYFCKVRTSNVFPYERYGPYTNFAHSDGQMERRTDGRTYRQGDSYIPPPQTLFGGGGYKN